MASPSKVNTPQQNILYLLERPLEPIFVPKGDRKSVFDVPRNEFLAKRFQKNAVELRERFAKEAKVRVQVKDITLPDLSFVMRLGRKDCFSIYIPRHQELTSSLLDIFLGMPTYDDFIAVAVYARDRVNPCLFVYALAVAVMHRHDVNVKLPSLMEVFPEKFVEGGIFKTAREEVTFNLQRKQVYVEIPMDKTASDLDEEHRVAYFREDLGVNLHHWHWHLVHPLFGKRSIVDKDRRGELFSYMHQQLVARYNSERLCNKLGLVKRLLNLREPIEEGYFPKLDTVLASRVWASRPAGAKLMDINRPDQHLRFDIQDLERWRDRILEAIQGGNAMDDKGRIVKLTEEDGIDILGKMVESNMLSINRSLYGNLHNLGHVAIGLTHDPDHRHLEDNCVMGDIATAARDPVFYRWHAFIDYIFQTHKEKLPPYSPAQLDYQGIRITNIEVITPGAESNKMKTFWRQEDIELTRGIDFGPRDTVFVKVTRLAHIPFTYRITVANESESSRVGTVRIFLAPKFDETRKTMLFRDQRHLFIELDKFQVTLNKSESNVIERQSSDSTVTVPNSLSFRELEKDHIDPSDPYCGCGWPENLLIPKGSESGFICQLFVMVSNFEDDWVEDSDSSSGTKKCGDYSTYCGKRGKKYPDRRAMGFPFDRLSNKGVDTLQQFLTPNMAVTDVEIIFEDRVEPPIKDSIPN